MFLILRPSNASGQFEIFKNAIIGLSEHRVRIKNVWVRTAEIIMSLAIDIWNGIWVDILTRETLWLPQVGICEPLRRAIAVVGYSRHVWMRTCVSWNVIDVVKGRGKER